MIPRSTTLTEQGRLVRGRLLWGLGGLVALLVLAFAFIALDRSTVIEGPAGSSFATTATGTAAFHETLDRVGREPVRLREPLSGNVLGGVDSYFLSDVEFGQFDESELNALAAFVEGGGIALVSGIPPRAILESFDVVLEWSGAAVGEVPVLGSLPNAATVHASRFGSFDPDHPGDPLAGSSERDLAVAFAHGAGTIIFVADSSLGHNATIDRADNVDFLGDIVEGRVAFDEYRHGYRNTSSGGLLAAAPGNWAGALVLGGIVLVLALVSYGRRFGPVEPTGRELVPDRSTYIEAVARSLRRAGGPIPIGPLRSAVIRRLRLPPDADHQDIADAARRFGLASDLSDALAHGGTENTHVLDRALATLSTRRGHHDDRNA
ncbi:MAG: DUF4350 domain-containing protein [Acidimicrobiia bacterium]